MWCEEKVIIIRNATPVVPIENCVQYQEGRICSTRRRFLQHQESVLHKKGTSVVENREGKKGTFVVEKQGVCCEKKVCSMKNVTSAIRREKVCSTKRKLCSVKRRLCNLREKCTVSEELHLQ